VELVTNTETEVFEVVWLLEVELELPEIVCDEEGPLEVVWLWLLASDIEVEEVVCNIEVWLFDTVELLVELVAELVVKLVKGLTVVGLAGKLVEWLVESAVLVPEPRVVLVALEVAVDAGEMLALVKIELAEPALLMLVLLAETAVLLGVLELTLVELTAMLVLAVLELTLVEAALPELIVVLEAREVDEDEYEDEDEDKDEFGDMVVPITLVLPGAAVLELVADVLLVDIVVADVVVTEVLEV
jgi:hypothetical protein